MKKFLLSLYLLLIPTLSFAKASQFLVQDAFSQSYCHGTPITLSFLGYGMSTMSSGTNVTALNVPSSIVTGDLLVAFIEVSTQNSSPTWDDTNWSAEVLTGIGVTGGNGTSGSRLNVYYKDAESATPNVTIDNPGNHFVGFIAKFRAGTTINVISTESRDTASTSISIANATATNLGCVYIALTTLAGDGDRTGICSSWANDTTSPDHNFVQEAFDEGSTAGNGGALCGGIYMGCDGSVSGNNFTVTANSSEVGGEAIIALCINH